MVFQIEFDAILNRLNCQNAPPQRTCLRFFLKTPILQKSRSRVGGNAIFGFWSLPKSIKKSTKRCSKINVQKEAPKFEFRHRFAVRIHLQMHPKTRPRPLRKTAAKKAHATRRAAAQLSRKPSPCCLHTTMYLPSYLISTPLSIY